MRFTELMLLAAATTMPVRSCRAICQSIGTMMQLVIHHPRHQVIIPLVIPRVARRTSIRHIVRLVPGFPNSNIKDCASVGIADEAFSVARRGSTRGDGCASKATAFPAHPYDIPRMRECSDGGLPAGRFLPRAVGQSWDHRHGGMKVHLRSNGFRQWSEEIDIWALAWYSGVDRYAILVFCWQPVGSGADGREPDPVLSVDGSRQNLRRGRVCLDFGVGESAEETC
jgi:hypothetical protein